MPQTGIIKPFDPTDPTKELKVLNWRSTVVDPATPIEDPVAVLCKDGDEFCHIGDIQAIEGHSGSKKTYLVSAFVAALIGAQPSQCLGFTTDRDENLRTFNTVLLVDTEQALGNVQKVQRRILGMASQAQTVALDSLKVLSLREYSPTERLEIVRQAIADYNPNVMFIDNIKDLVNDFNDIEESQRVVGEIMKMSSGKMSKQPMAIICVIHQNFSSDKARGHLGSLIYEKSSLVMTLKVDGVDTRVTYSKVRNAKPADFSFCIDAFGMPQLSSSAPSNHAGHLRTVMENLLTVPMSYTELTNALMKATNKSESTCNRTIRTAVANGIIRKNGETYELLSDNDKLPF